MRRKQLHRQMRRTAGVRSVPSSWGLWRVSAIAFARNERSVLQNFYICNND